MARFGAAPQLGAVPVTTDSPHVQRAVLHKPKGVKTYVPQKEHPRGTATMNKSINQSNFHSTNIPGKARPHWRDSQVSVQQQNRGNSSVTSTVHRACRYLWGKGQVKEICLQKFLSKVLEKVVVNQLNSHINSSNTSNQYQSAYRKYHSTKTALLKIHNDTLASMDNGEVTAPALRDLSAAFDTIDHTILLRRLDG